MDVLTLNKNNKTLFGEINLPSSKSISNRALIIQFLSKQTSKIDNLSNAYDTILMVDLLDRIITDKGANVDVFLDCNNSGTVLRFLTSVLAQQPGNWILSGSERMKKRPIGILVESLRQLGANINYLEELGFPPIQITGKELGSKEIVIESDVSSQFITALLLISPTLPNGLSLVLKNQISSLPYIKMTLNLMKSFGINSTFEKNLITIDNQEYKRAELTIEPDWTSATYWYEMVALTDKANIILKDLKPSDVSTKTFKYRSSEIYESLQGDSILPEVYNSFGVESEFIDQGVRLTKKGMPVSKFEFDFTNHPDLAQSVIVTCAALGISGDFTGLESLRIKETDRLHALQTELQKCGFNVKTVQSSKFDVRSSGPIKTGIINTYGDHRMAMTFAPLALKYNSIQIENPKVVSKSYPRFWEDLSKVGFESLFHKKDIQ